MRVAAVRRPLRRALAGPGVKVATVVNFPAGTDAPDAAAAVTAAAIAAGADEIDVVLPYTAWLAGDVEHATVVLDAVRRGDGRPDDEGHHRDRRAARPGGHRPGRHFAIANGADFVKTSTGKTPVSATPEAVRDRARGDRRVRPSGRVQGVGRHPHAGRRRTYLELADEIMGPGWATPATFRFGASSLLDALQAVDRRRCAGRTAAVLRCARYRERR